MNVRYSRRRFLRVSVAAGATFTILKAGSARGYAANEQLNVALVGVAGRGSWFVQTVPRIGENVVNLACEVIRNERSISFAFTGINDAQRTLIRSYIDGHAQRELERLASEAPADLGHP